jgi:copper transport protein
VALAFPAVASAHARLVGSKPADGAVLATPPRDVRVLFDDQIRVAGGNRAVDARGRSVLSGSVHRLEGNRQALVIPLRPGLPRGSYTVRWSVVSDDGHLIRGVLAFAVGAGSPRPVPSLSAGGGTSVPSAVFRVLFVLGALLAGGGALAGRILLERSRRRLATVDVVVGLALVAGGGFGLLALEPATEATRFGRVAESAAIVALVGIAAALASLRAEVFAYGASAVGLLELVAPTLSGHALDPRRLRALVAVADLAHVLGAAFWVGGLVVLLLSRGPLARRRFPLLALGAVALLGAAAIPRAVAAVPAVHDLVDTSYGRALIVKTAVLAAALAIAGLNRRRLRRAGFGIELAMLAVIVATAGVLTDLRPPGTASAAPAVVSKRPPPPPLDAVVLGGQDDDLAVGLAASPLGRRLAVRVTALGQDGLGVDRLRVAVDGSDTTSCGSGCYAATVPLPLPPRRIAVSVSGRGRAATTVPFVLPARWPAKPAADLVARAGRVYRSLRSLVIHERLASSARNVVVTTYRIHAPNRLAYRIVRGPQAVIIGGTRWDRTTAGGRWERSATEPLREPEPFWGSDPVRNAHLLRTGQIAGRPVSIVSFFDPRLPAWFELWIDRRTDRLLALHMTAQAHFMRHRYSGFDVPMRIEPPR